MHKLFIIDNFKYYTKTEECTTHTHESLTHDMKTLDDSTIFTIYQKYIIYYAFNYSETHK